MPIFAIFHKSTKIRKRFSGVTAPNITKFVHDVATFNALPSCPRAIFQSILEWKSKNEDSSAKNVDFATFIGCHGNAH